MCDICLLSSALFETMYQNQRLSCLKLLMYTLQNSLSKTQQFEFLPCSQDLVNTAVHLPLLGGNI